MTSRAPLCSPIRDRAYALLVRALGQRPMPGRLISWYATEAMVDALCDLEERFQIDLEADEVFLQGLTVADLLDLVEARANQRCRRPAQLFTLADFRRSRPAAAPLPTRQDLA